MDSRRHTSRRTFLKKAAAVGGTMAMAPATYAAIQGANNRINLAMIGLGVRGGEHMSGLLMQRDALNIAVTCCCDVYRRRGASFTALWK